MTHNGRRIYAFFISFQFDIDAKRHKYTKRNENAAAEMKIFSNDCWEFVNTAAVAGEGSHYKGMEWQGIWLRNMLCQSILCRTFVSDMLKRPVSSISCATICLNKKRANKRNATHEINNHGLK